MIGKQTFVPTRFDLKIKCSNGSNFVIAKVKQHTTIFEIKIGIEKLKNIKIESISLTLPDYLKSALTQHL